MNYCKPDYDNCLVNLSNSILKAFGAETTAPTLKIAYGCDGNIDPRETS